MRARSFFRRSFFDSFPPVLTRVLGEGVPRMFFVHALHCTVRKIGLRHTNGLK